MAKRRIYHGALPTKQAESSNVELVMNTNQFNKRLLNYSGFSAAMLAVLSMWSKEGLFTALMAKKTLGIVRKAINEGRRPDGKSWEDLDPDYREWKKLHFGVDTPWQLTGSVRGNLLTRKTSDGWSVGLDRRVRVPKIQYGRKGQRAGRSGSMSLEEYANMVEHGTERMKARPLFLPAMTVMVQENYPRVSGMVKQSIDQAIIAFRIKREASPKYQKPGEVTSQAALSMSKGKDAIRGMNENDSRVREILAGKASKVGSYEVVNVSGMDTTANRKQAKQDKRLVSTLIKNDPLASPEEKAEVEKWLEKHYGEY